MTKKKKPMIRSEDIARVKNKNTKPELYLRKNLYGIEVRTLENNRNLRNSF